MKLSDAVNLFKKTPTKITADLNGEAIVTSAVTLGAHFPAGASLTFRLVGGTVDHALSVDLDISTKRMILSLDGAVMKSPTMGKVADIDIHFLKVTTEFRWTGENGQQNKLTIRVSKNPFAAFFGGS